MKIGNYNVGLGGIYNPAKRAANLELENKRAKKEFQDELKKTAANVLGKVTKQALTRSRAGVKQWQNARVSAESELMPNNTEIIRIYKDIEIDAHLWALMQTIRLKVVANNFAVYDENDEIDDEATEKMQKKWFRNIIVETVDASFYGFSLVQLGDIVNGIFTNSSVVPREYVVQQKWGVKKHVGDPTNLIKFDDRKFVNWLVPIGEPRDLGILDKAAPLVIKKKEVISAWSEAAELFGIPMRIGRTDINNPALKENMDEMLEDMGEAAWATIDKEDEIEILSTSKTDFSNLYDNFVDRVNSELSKLILLQTGTTDEKSFVGSAEVHEGILRDVIEAYILKVEDVANEIVIPICQRHGLIKAGCYLKANNEQKIPPSEMIKIVTELLTHYNIPLEWINETFDVPVEEKPVDEPKDPQNEPNDPKGDDIDEPNDGEPIDIQNAAAFSVMQAMKKMYKGVIKTKENE